LRGEPVATPKIAVLPHIRAEQSDKLKARVRQLEEELVALAEHCTARVGAMWREIKDLKRQLKER
jgi:deferrochelatase/peroxidase EfeB